MPKAPKRTTSDIHKAIADKVIKQMETAGTGWAKDWAVPQSEQPTSMSTGREYRGINWLILGMARAANGYTTGRWATYRQWFVKGGGVDEWVTIKGRKKRKIIKPSKYNVKAGSTGTHVFLFKPVTIEDKETGEKKSIRLSRTFVVFNADQVDGYDAPAADDFEWSEMPATAADDLAERAGAIVKNADPASAFYVPSKDYINMPQQCQFASAESYAGTLLHELTHWSGHESRCDRKIRNSFGTKDYAYEELVAELGAAMMCGSLGISPSPRDDHAKYLNSWIERLKSEPKLILSAAAKANQAAEWIFDAADVQQSEVAEAA